MVHDTITLILLGLLAFLVALPLALIVAWKVTRPVLPRVPFRWLYAVWACLLAASSVWTLSRDPRFSVEEAGADNYVRLAFLALGMLLIVFIGAKYKFGFIKEATAGVLGVFSILGIWSLTSTMWSVSPPATLYKSLEYCAMLALFALTASVIKLSVADARGRLMALKGVFDFGWFLTFLLIASVYAGIILFPGYAIVRNYRDTVGAVGFSIQGALPGMAENAVGQLGAVLGVVCLVRLLQKSRSWLLYAPLFVLSVLTMVLSQSRSPVLAFLLGAIVVLVASRRFWVLISSGAFLGLALVAQYGDLIYDFMRRGQNEQDLISLTGRVTYWSTSVEAVQERLLSGYGANAGGRYVLESILGESGVSTVHNTWIEVLLDTGVIGLALMVVGLGLIWYYLFKLYRPAMADPLGRLLWLESLGVLTVLCVRSMFAVNLVWSWNVLTLGIVVVFVSVMGRQVVRKSRAGVAFAQPVPAARRRRSGVYG